MAIAYDKDGARILVTEDGVAYFRSIRWEDCIVSAAGTGETKVDKAYINSSSQLVLVLEDESEVIIFTDGRITFNSALDADEEYSGFGFYGVAGTTLVLGDTVYKSSTDSRWELARGNAEATIKPEVAMIIVGGDDGDAILLSQDVHIREDDWNWTTVGAPLFISPDTAGDMDESAPTTGEYAKVVAHVTSADSVHFRPDNAWVKVG